MKCRFACSLVATTFMLAGPVVAHAQSQGMGGMEMKSDKKAQVHEGSGTITKIDRQKNRVSIAHGPVQSMNWPAMTMTFKAKDKVMLDNVKEGEKVDFAFVQSGRDYELTRLK